MALWGVLGRELLDHPLDSSAFKHATEQFTLFAQAVLNAADAEDGPDPTRLFRSIKDLFTLSETSRQEPLVMALQPLTTHHLFPMEIMPEWAQPKSTGTWQAFKSIMTSEIKLPFGRPKLKVEASAPPSPDPPSKPEKTPEPPSTRPTPPPIAVQQLQAAQAQAAAPDPVDQAIANPGPPLDEAGVNERRPRPSKPVRRNVLIPQDSFSSPTSQAPPTPAPTAPAPPPDPQAPQEPELSPGDGGYESSLAYKLNQDLSLKNLKNVFSHEISFFKRKKKKDDDDDEE